MRKNSNYSGPSITEWSRLRDDDLNPIRNKWKGILEKSNPREQSLHAFLARHAHLAFQDDFNFATVVSKLKLGAEFVTDFLCVYDFWSNGISYKLIEIEKPQIAPFTQEGIPSAGLSRAIQQVLSWKLWLEEHKSETRRLFPTMLSRSGGGPAFRYEIIIGTRDNSLPWLDRRRMLSESLGVSIRSFDSFTSRFENTWRFGDFSSVGDEKHKTSLATRNQLACPFATALSDKSWREMLKNGVRAEDHFMGWYAELLVKHREENEYARRFRKILRRR